MRSQIGLKKPFFLFLVFTILAGRVVKAQEHSVAREWNEVLLEAIRNDQARPTVHARNLFHTSVIAYDAWAILDDKATPYLLGKNVAGFYTVFDLEDLTEYSDEQKDSISTIVIDYATYRLLTYRFRNSPNQEETQDLIDSVFLSRGNDVLYVYENYSGNNYAALGNYLGSKMIQYGQQDGANDQNDYANLYYESKNEPLVPAISGNNTLEFVNHWQPLALDHYTDQSGNVIPRGSFTFLSPEWGGGTPFALKDSEKEVLTRGGEQYVVYHDPGEPSYLTDSLGEQDFYKYGFLMVSAWGAHLSPADSVKWDISPKSLGNLTSYPESEDGMRAFYDFEAGGDNSLGRALNPKTGMEYESNIVLRGDYTRVLAEFWADGPDSETPPGHWFTLLNYVTDHNDFVRKFEGVGNDISQLEWDVKAYFALGGAMHDAAITAWGIKGYYDYLRPVSAIRYMAEQGQSSDVTLSNFSIHGLPLYEGVSEIVDSTDELAGVNYGNVGKVKLYTWKGPEYIGDPDTTEAGVGWILAEDWWPYQRPSFVTPPFAGYVSGHSVFSRAAADILTSLTGDEYFPGGMGEFVAKKNEFLVFEDGPSEDVTLQWATYRDASDQTSLSRIWGGIHPPVDDTRGRLIGARVADSSFELSKLYFNGEVITTEFSFEKSELIVMNPIEDRLIISFESTKTVAELSLTSMMGQEKKIKFEQSEGTVRSEKINVEPGVYVVRLLTDSNKLIQSKVVVK